MDAAYRTLAAAVAFGGEFTVADLSVEAGVKESTVRTVLNRNRSYFERAPGKSGRPGGQRQLWRVRQEAEEELRTTVEGIEERFSAQRDDDLEISGSGQLGRLGGPPLRVSSPNPELATADDLDRYLVEPAIDLLPRLVQRLILQAPGITRCSVPTGEGIRLHGYDGRVTASSESLNVPEGPSVWEFGAGGTPARKIREDLNKRIRKPRDVVPAEATFVAVALRRFPEKDDWAEEQRNTGIWRDIRVLDADDLYGWVQRHLSVHVWLSAVMGLQPAAVEPLDSWFETWRAQTVPALPQQVFLAGRADLVEQLRRSATPGQLVSVWSRSREEALAFIGGAFGVDADAEATSIRFGSALLVKSEDEWSRLTDSLKDGILIPAFSDADVASATSNGLTVVLPLGPTSDRQSATVEVSRIDLTVAARQLEEAGVPRGEAERVAREVDRSLTSFRRTHALNPDYAMPSWVDEAPGLIAQLNLLGGWNPASSVDRQIVGRVVDRPYADIDGLLRRLALKGDAPFFESGGSWHSSSPNDAFVLAGAMLTGELLERWRSIALDVLQRPDRPSASEEVVAALEGAHERPSGVLRRGMAFGAVLLGALGDSDQRTYADTLVRLLLSPTSRTEDWVELSDVLPMLAEAAPDEFLDSVEDALGNSPKLAGLFTDDERAFVFSGRSPHTNLLWALELLCRSKDHAPRACFVLARLAELDPGGRMANRPLDSLRRVLLPWHPQIAATGSERVTILNSVLERVPPVGWQLVLSLLPGQFDATHPTYRPELRNWHVDAEVSMAERFSSWRAITEVSLGAAITDPTRLVDLVDTAQTLHTDDRSELLSQLRGLEVQDWDPGVKLEAWRSLSSIVMRHRQFPHAQWAMSAEDLTNLEAVADSWAPSDPVLCHAALFESHPAIPVPRNEGDSHGYEGELDRRRRLALNEIVAAGGAKDLVRLMEECSEPGSAGYLVAAEFGDEVAEAMMDAIGGNGARALAARGWLARMANDRDSSWLRLTLGTIRQLDEASRLHAYQAVPDRDEVLDLVVEEDESIRRAFWSQSTLLLLRSSRTEEIVGELLRHGQVRGAVSFLAHKAYGGPVPRDLIIRTLHALTSADLAEPVSDGMLPHEVGRLLDALEQGGEDERVLSQFEWALFSILEYERPARALYGRLASRPEEFVELVCHVFRGAHDQVPSREEYDASASARLRTSYAVLRVWRTVPGTRQDGSIDRDRLMQWVSKARELLEVADRLDIGDECIGQLLSGSPLGLDDIWPAEAVRDLLESITGRHIRAGIEIGRFNARGVTSRGAFDGGAQERALAEQYEVWARKVATRWPNTARILRDLSRNYREWAEREDDRAEAWRDRI